MNIAKLYKSVRITIIMALKALTLRKKKNKKAKKVHGFLARMKTTSGRAIIRSRRRKGRKQLTTV